MTPPHFERRTLLKATLGAASVAVVGTELAAATAAQAAPSTEFPWIIDCDSWGAKPPTSGIVLRQGTTRKIIVHHTAYPNSTDYSREQAIWLARDIQRLHQQVNGWADSGQHFTISRGGYVLEGRRRSLETLETGLAQVQAAHCPGRNHDSIGIENEGTYISETPPEALWNSLVRLSVAICEQYNIKAHNMFGHWDFRATLCPGAAFYRQFPQLRRDVARELGTPTSEIPLRTWPDIYSSIGGPVVRAAQWLLRHRGYELPVTGPATWSPAMTAAIQDWQTKNGLPASPDGTMTTETWETLAPELDKDATGDPVSAIQNILPDKGYPDVTITGAYDHATKKAVQDLQRLHGLEPNGKVDTSTWCVIVGGIVREAF
ncbi:peptidoglycan recognition protein family protein [Allorhizocola rhizosphaerae]|uniref:peptidoglycan recognition protein family protein n=1 Tax=Allorhizocola rhizosphaerae TaxID=1872709 RepID=UPI001FEC701B|nr:N-acetylmuramoyl-L-alanine amidase [Allorhizocola rhizosphaerae]